LAREGSQRSIGKGIGFDAKSDGLDIAAIAEAWQEAGDKRLWRLIVSPENASKLDLKAHARDLIASMERDLGTRLEWVAIDHHNTDNPHIHMLVRGLDDRGRVLEMSPEYVQQGIRDRSQETASRELGLRTEREILWTRGAAIERMQWTEIDRALQRLGGVEKIVSLADDEPRNDFARVRAAQNVQRLTFLESIDLAERLGPATWRLAEDHEHGLREQQRALDIIKTRAAHEREIPDNRTSLTVTRLQVGERITGRVVGTGLENESSDNRYIILETTDGGLHQIRQSGAIERARGDGGLTLGSIATLSRRAFDKDGRQLSYIAVEEHGPLEAMLHDKQAGNALDLATVHQLQRNGSLSNSREVHGFAERWHSAMEKRLAILEGDGVISRDARGSWRVDPERVRAIELSLRSYQPKPRRKRELAREAELSLEP
jgi:type IV secretory pathway VirD2 relaxase